MRQSGHLKVQFARYHQLFRVNNDRSRLRRVVGHCVMADVLSALQSGAIFFPLFLYKALTFASFHVDGKWASWSDLLNISVSGKARESAQSRRTLG